MIAEKWAPKDIYALHILLCPWMLCYIVKRAQSCSCRWLRLMYIKIWKLFWVIWVYTIYSSRSWKMEKEGGRMNWVVSKEEQRGAQHARRIQSALLTVKMEEEAIIRTVFRSWTSALLTAKKKPVSQWRNWTLPSTEMIRELHAHLQSLQKGA